MKSAMVTVPLALAAIGWIAVPPPAGAQHKARQTYDLIIRHGTIYDGSAKPPFIGDVAIQGDKIVVVGSLKNARGRTEIDATGLAVAPGFINMLSWATESLLYDGRSQSDIRQGVTLEVFGEGGSMGPLNEKMKKEMLEQQGDIKFDIKWSTLAEYLDYLVQRGISPMWPLLSAPPPCAFTRSDTKTVRPRLPNSSACAPWFDRRWNKAHWVSGPRLSTRRPFMPRPTSWWSCAK